MARDFPELAVKSVPDRFPPASAPPSKLPANSAAINYGRFGPGNRRLTALPGVEEGPLRALLRVSMLFSSKL